RFMLERRRAGQNTVLILDEAQNLDAATLEKIRMLSNLETPTEKLLQIMLVGQPELRAKLASPALRQLQQRIELQCSLAPLSRAQVRDYIQTRLRVAGARDLDLFSGRAQNRIAAYSRGIPRRVHIARATLGASRARGPRSNEQILRGPRASRAGGGPPDAGVLAASGGRPVRLAAAGGSTGRVAAPGGARARRALGLQGAGDGH